jgi:hypothetical protein
MVVKVGNKLFQGSTDLRLSLLLIRPNAQEDRLDQPIPESLYANCLFIKKNTIHNKIT